MSRIGKKPHRIPEGVTVAVDRQTITVTGPKGSLTHLAAMATSVSTSDSMVTVTKKGNSKEAAALWGTTARLIANMITGVTEGFQKQLELNGVGFRMAVKGKQVDLALGFSHPVFVDIPEGITVTIEKNILTVAGIDRQVVGQFTANLRALKPAEPYKGKGFRYSDEIVRRKEGKRAVATAS